MNFEKKMPGYTGFKPKYAEEEENEVSRDNRFYIPGKLN